MQLASSANIERLRAMIQGMWVSVVNVMMIMKWVFLQPNPAASFVATSRHTLIASCSRCQMWQIGIAVLMCCHVHQYIVHSTRVHSTLCTM